MWTGRARSSHTGEGVEAGEDEGAEENFGFVVLGVDDGEFLEVAELGVEGPHDGGADGGRDGEFNAMSVGRL